MKIFGREPALWLAFLGALVALLAAFEFPWLNAGQAAALVAVVVAVVTAITTRPVAPALFAGATTVTFTLLAEYGFNFSDAVIGGVAALMMTAFGLFGVRPQVAPNNTAVSSS